MPRPKEDDLFAEEQTMPAMSFGDHIEELRSHLILAILGLAIGVVITFIPFPPPLDKPSGLGARVMRLMQEPAQRALDKFYSERANKRAAEARLNREWSTPSQYQIDLAELAEALKKILPPTAESSLPPTESLKGQTVTLTMSQERSSQIMDIAGNVEKPNALISLAPLEAFSIFFMVCIITGLVVSSPWVYLQLWLFIGPGLYRHERNYVKKFLPFSLGLFLAGVFLCFFLVLPVMLKFLLGFNVWLGIEPSLRISDWVGFASILPLIFGICFQTPLVMLIVERIGIFTAEDFRSKWKHVILGMVVFAAVVTPTQDPFSLSLLAVPMILLYGLGLLLIRHRNSAVASAAA